MCVYVYVKERERERNRTRQKNGTARVGETWMRERV